MENGFMKILAEMPTGMGSKWILAEFENNFYGYGSRVVTEKRAEEIIQSFIDSNGKIFLNE